MDPETVIEWVDAVASTVALLVIFGAFLMVMRSNAKMAEVLEALAKALEERNNG